ncbi:MAG: hypothetical protein AB7G93_08095 [Bdellovibrionales bacterium]
MKRDWDREMGARGSEAGEARRCQREIQVGAWRDVGCCGTSEDVELGTYGNNIPLY